MFWFTLTCLSKQIEMPPRSIPTVEVGRNLHWKLYSGLIVDLLDQTSGIEHQVMFESREPAMKHFSVP